MIQAVALRIKCKLQPVNSNEHVHILLVFIQETFQEAELTSTAPTARAERVLRRISGKCLTRWSSLHFVGFTDEVSGSF